MPVKNYVSRNGQVEYEYDDLGDILTYGRDALGNVVAGYDAATNAVFTADYKPYGEFAATTGNVAGRRFMWVGSWGYRFTSGVPVSHYVRARHLSMRMGMWTSVDPLWPSEPAFGYVGGMAIKAVDPSGLAKTKMCSVYWCDVDPGRWGVKPGHRFTCVNISRPDGTHRNCSGGLNPRSDGVDQLVGPGKFGDEYYECPVTDIPGVKCQLIVQGSNDHDVCRFADNVCKCLEMAKKSPGVYSGIANNCIHFSFWVIECACKASGAFDGPLGRMCRKYR